VSHAHLHFVSAGLVIASHCFPLRRFAVSGPCCVASLLTSNSERMVCHISHQHHFLSGDYPAHVACLACLLPLHTCSAGGWDSGAVDATRVRGAAPCHGLAGNPTLTSASCSPFSRCACRAANTATSYMALHKRSRQQLYVSSGRQHVTGPTSRSRVQSRRSGVRSEGTHRASGCPVARAPRPDAQPDACRTCPHTCLLRVAVCGGPGTHM
jgi:hypothetical protein